MSLRVVVDDVEESAWEGAGCCADRARDDLRGDIARTSEVERFATNGI